MAKLILSRLRLPAIAAPMFLVSGPELVIATCKAGVVGTFPALNQRTTEGFDEWVTQIGETLSGSSAGVTSTGTIPAPYGVNLIVHRSNPRLQADVAVCVKHKVPVIITSLGAVPELVQTIQSYGGLVFHDVISLRHAQKAAEAGVDGLILVSAGAGGHAGTLNPFAFLAEVRAFFQGTIILAGAMSDGRSLAAARVAGADLGYFGTRFIATVESRADDAYKRMILGASAGDIVYTPKVSGVAGNFLSESLKQAGIDPEGRGGHTPTMDFTDEREYKAWRDIWSAGHGVGTIVDIPPVGLLVDRLAAEYRQAMAEAARDPFVSR